jgi:hypothetical protein
MNARVEEHEESQHPPIPDEGIPAEEPPERRDGERRREDAQRPSAGLLLELLVRRGAKVGVQRAPEKPRKRQETDEEDERLADEIRASRAMSRNGFPARRG